MLPRLALCFCGLVWVGGFGGYLVPAEAKGRALKGKEVVVLQSFLQGKPTPARRLRRWLLKEALPTAVLRRLYRTQAKRLRNTIFALKGARFRSRDLRRFFAKQRWYEARYKASKVRLGKVARRNVDRLLFTERLVYTFGRFVGEWPRALDKRKSRYCFRFKRQVLIQTPKRVLVLKRGKRPCVVRKARVLMRIKRAKPDGAKVQVRGFFGDFVLLHAVGASDYQHIRLYNWRQKKLVFRQDKLAPTAAFAFVHQTLLFERELQLPLMCAKRGVPYMAQLAACWRILQKMHPGLRGVSLPKCKCRGGLAPYLIGQFRLFLRKPKWRPKATGQVKCGCAS